MSLCPSCAHQIESWQHRASCQPVEAKVPNPSRRRLEEPVVTRATNRATTRATPRVVARGPVARPETRPETPKRPETPSDEVSGQPKGGRPKKWASEAERKKASRDAKKVERPESSPD